MNDSREYMVYMLKLVDGRVYIGMTSQRIASRCRKDGYRGCPSMKEAIDKYGWDSFERSVLLSGLSRKEAEEKERFYIDQYDSTNPSKGFNIALAGNIKGRHSTITRQKMSDVQKGREFSEDHLNKLRKPKKGGSLRRKIRQYLPDGTFVREHQTIYDAIESVKGREECISRCCNGKQQLHRGYRWSYSEVTV